VNPRERGDGTLAAMAPPDDGDGVDDDDDDDDDDRGVGWPRGDDIGDDDVDDDGDDRDPNDGGERGERTPPPALLLLPVDPLPGVIESATWANIGAG
jgi:hypothetical protein